MVTDTIPPPLSLGEPRRKATHSEIHEIHQLGAIILNLCPGGVSLDTTDPEIESLVKRWKTLKKLFTSN